MTKLKTLVILLAFIIAFSDISSNANAAFNSSSIIIKPLPSPVINFIGTYNFHKVDNNYYRGGQPDENDYQSYALLGIKTIINLRNADKDDVIKQEKIAKRFGLNYISIPMKASQPPTNEQIAFFFKVFDKPENLPVYVHCWQGKDRTGIMTALYRVRDYGWDFTQAYSEMMQRGYHSFIYPKQKEFLQNYTRKVISIKKN
ncbi:MAG: tyrosine-protein phosphatase [Candidatus Gastranaerophilales bacterium]|nr:tyrosine-protein phosphatase [Candidatus Gastranaerophilales bacterium]